MKKYNFIIKLFFNKKKYICIPKKIYFTYYLKEIILKLNNNIKRYNFKYIYDKNIKKNLLIKNKKTIIITEAKVNKKYKNYVIYLTKERIKKKQIKSLNNYLIKTSRIKSKHKNLLIGNEKYIPYPIRYIKKKYILNYFIKNIYKKKKKYSINLLKKMFKIMLNYKEKNSFFFISYLMYNL
ncbi:hypothetical protein [Candidatus Vidania fulgoroideorum]